MNIEAVIFDMDGVITDTEKYYNRTWPQAFAAFGYTDFTSDDALTQRSLNHADAQILWEKRYGSDFSFEKVRQYNTKLVLKMMEEEGIHAKPGIQPLLQYLKEHQIKSAVATATKLERALPRLSSVGLDTAFDTVISASMVKKGKPHPDVYLHACRTLGIAPQYALALEDSPNGIRSAASAGCVTVMVPDLTMPTPDLMPLLYDCVPHLEAVIELLNKIGKE